VSEKSISELVSLEGRAVVITGGARGIGAAIATRLVEAGASVMIGDLDSQGAKDTAERLSVPGGRAFGVNCDMSNADSVR
jgi:NAD(P)-dependent dehydrogenase (short-subunit alcohol dehydrogenase family)